MNVLSLFDGMSCGRISLERMGISVTNYYASEIDKHAVKVSSAKYPDTIHLGSVTGVNGFDLPPIDLLIGGSPCQGFSFAGKGLNFSDPRSALFFEYVRILNECRSNNPNILFLLENVRMKKEHEDVISRILEIQPININSALVSAQNRERLYWTNIALERHGLFGDNVCTITHPKDKGIYLRDILQNNVPEKYYLSEKALARIIRGKYSKPKINPDKSGTINTKNNSGQLSVDSGTTLIVDVDGNPKRNQDKASCFTAGAHSAGNHSDMDVIIQQACVRLGRTENAKKQRKEFLKSGKDYSSFRDREIVGFDTNKMNTVTAATAKDNIVVGMYQLPRGKNKGGNIAMDGKTPTISSCSWEHNNMLINGLIYRRLTPIEVCRLQTVPDDYFFIDGKQIVSDSQIYKMCGNGWTVDIIAHIFSYMNMAKIKAA